VAAEPGEGSAEEGEAAPVDLAMMAALAGLVAELNHKYEVLKIRNMLKSKSHFQTG
jgi:hypothetical protein|tara:strand:- start:206 stop:373 length:168 start_codon:yes stop_codon:yes gene_type:complete